MSGLMAQPGAFERLEAAARDPVQLEALRAAGLAEELAGYAAEGHGDLPVMRTVHQFACTGGTLISKCIASMPCTRLLSEVDPFSELGHQQSFVPSDLIGLAKLGSAPPAQKTLAKIFLAGLAELAADSRVEGRDLVLRDHSHSHFCYGGTVPERPSLAEILSASYQLRSLVTVRHPLDSYLSLRRQQWLHFTPATLEEYAVRYHLFLDHYDGVEILRYEDFTAAPEASMQQICSILRLAYNPDFKDNFSALHLSGDSGRSGVEIAYRPRRALSVEVLDELPAAAGYIRLCERLGYEALPETETGTEPVSSAP